MRSCARAKLVTSASRTGKHTPKSEPTPGTRFTLGTAAERYQDRYWHDRQFATVAVLQKLVAERGLSLTTVSVAWLLANPVITAPIIGASRPEQLADTLKGTELTLDAELLGKLNELTLEYRRGDAER